MSQSHSSRRFLDLISTLSLCGIFLVLGACHSRSSSGSKAEPTPSFSIGGTVTGLNGIVVVQNNGGDNLTLTANGGFTFPTALPDGSAYALTVLTNPSSPVHQTCTPSNDSGTTHGANVTNIAIVCSTNSYTVGGSVAGLTGTVVLQNNAGDDLSLSANGSFTFATSVADTASYDVAILTQPAGQTCSVVNSSNTVNGNNVTNVTVTCSAFAYVTHLSPDAFNTSRIQQYLLGQDGLLSFSQNATPTDGHYGQMAFATVNGTQYAYILENGVIYCSINSDGIFNNCTPTIAPTNGLHHPHGIAFATLNGAQYAYLADPSSSSLFQCSVDITNGNLSSCTEYVDANIDAALGIAFNTDGNSVQHAYVADAATGMVVCPIDATGSFTNPPGCVTTPLLGAPFWIPYGIAFTTAGGTRYAYVADNGVGANLGHVYRCLLNADGTFTDNGCVATPTDTSSFAPWNPYSITFKTLNGTQYAYVINNQSVNIGSIYRCTVDETTGLLTQNCIKTPDIPTDRDTWQPSGISFR